MDIKQPNDIIIYQSNTGAIEFKGDFQKETLWATQAQISDIFDVDRSVVTKHIRNILKDNELIEEAVCAKFAHTAADNKAYQVKYYNLDVVLAVGYRTNSTRAIQFRQWATERLREHIVDGYTINRSRISTNYDKFLKAVQEVKSLIPPSGAIDSESAIELIKLFANTWISLDAYDKSTLPTGGITLKKVIFTANELETALIKLKQELIEKNEATDLFATEKQNEAFAGIVGNIYQSFDGNDLYPSMEEKAAHLLYFVIKNHPFVDGNKRSGAFAFVWFLRQARILDTLRLTPEALTALTLLVAESNPKDKERIIGLILMLLKI